MEEHANLSPTMEPPTGWSFTESPSNSTIYGIPPPIRKPELDFNKCVYWRDHSYFGEVDATPWKLRKIIRNPRRGNIDCTLYSPLKMKKDPSAPARIGHIPNITDLIRVPDAFKVFLDWSLCKLDEEGSKNIVPEFARYILDPKFTIPDSGLIYLMRTDVVQVLMASYVHDLHVMHIMAPMSHIRMTMFSSMRVRRGDEWHYSMVRLRGGISELNPLPPHTPILIWSVRGCARPSFVSHFWTIFGVHQPVVIVLLETRVTEQEFAEVHALIGTTMKYECVNGVGISGGMVVMWCENDVDVDVIRAESGPNAIFVVEVMVSY